MRDAIYETDPARVKIDPLPADDSERWPFPAAKDPATWVEISAARFDELLNVLPPIGWAGGGFFVGEASTSDHRGVTVYTRCQKQGGRYFCRDLPRDKTREACEGLAALLGAT